MLLQALSVELWLHSCFLFVAGPRPTDVHGNRSTLLQPLPHIGFLCKEKVAYVPPRIREMKAAACMNPVFLFHFETLLAKFWSTDFLNFWNVCFLCGISPAFHLSEPTFWTRSCSAVYSAHIRSQCISFKITPDCTKCQIKPEWRPCVIATLWKSISAINSPNGATCGDSTKPMTKVLLITGL